MILLVSPIAAQRGDGQLHLQVLDPSGAGVSASVELVSKASQLHRTFATDSQGRHIAYNLPLGVYQLTISHEGFATASQLVEIPSQVAVQLSVALKVAVIATQVEVSDSATLINPYATSTIYSVPEQEIDDKVSPSPGRGLSELMNEQPGWLYEANGVLHPRGSEYDVQFVVDGLPITENRSPAFSPPFEEQNVELLQVQTAGYPAEYGRKLGGVVEVTTQKDAPSGLHGEAVLNGGSFATTTGYVGLSYARSANQFTLSGSGGITDRYLDPPVLANYTNHGSLSGFSGSYGRQLTSQSHLRLALSHSSTSFFVPNELLQQNAGQRQGRRNEETRGQVSYQTILSNNLELSASGSVRDSAATLSSNNLSTPIIAEQDRGFREGYARVDLAGQRGKHHWKVGMDGMFSAVHENLSYLITDPAQFDPSVQPSFQFADKHNDREFSAFAQDAIQLKNWNLSAGIRFDRYRFVVDQFAWSPRLALARYFPKQSLLVHVSYDRIFQTPAVENLLLASSPQVDQVSNAVLRLPVLPARAHFYEAGIAKGITGSISFTANIFRRDFRNYSDDDLLLNTGVSFPIVFSSANIQGIEAKLEAQKLGHFSGFLSYANQRGTGQGPITGGLFLGSEAQDALSDTSHFPITQDQRNTIRAQVRYQATERAWLALASSFDSGLPIEAEGGNFDLSFLLAQYGPEVLNRVNLARGRVRPSWTMDVSSGVDLYRRERRTVVMLFQVTNLTNRVNVIDFAGLFSGTALAPRRAVSAQLRTDF
jgi:hypothetical protein